MQNFLTNYRCARTLVVTLLCLLPMQIAPMKIIALNDAQSSENKIHSDDIAAKYGFSGALVSGVNVFGYLSQPLISAYSEDCLSHGIMDVIFLKPAYHNDLLTITTENKDCNANERHHLSSAFNQADELLAKLESWRPQELPPVNELAFVECEDQSEQRQEIHWDLIHLRKPAALYDWSPSVADNKLRVDAQRDGAEIYQGENGFVHPYYLLDACNKALMRMFILPAWIHTGSRLISRQAIRAGQKIEVRAVPIQKWERKGHQFIKLYISMNAENGLALEVEHTAIFKIAS